MKALRNARKLTRLLESPVLLNSDRLAKPSILLQSRNQTALFSSYSHLFSGKSLEMDKFSNYAMTIPRANFSVKATTKLEVFEPTEDVKEIYDNIYDSVIVRKTMSPNAWLWSMIEKCQNKYDIKLLFDILGKLRIFRMSNLRISSDFNLALCLEVTRTCVRVGAIQFAKKTMWKNNVYGLTPTVASADEILRYAKEKNSAKLMEQIMDLVESNKLLLMPSTADLVFSICYSTDKWKLLAKYSEKFVESKVKLGETALDVWTEFATKLGDDETLSYIEKLRSISEEDQSLAS